MAGGEAPSLGHWIAHHRAMGIERIHVHMHLNSIDDPHREAIEADCRRMGCPIAEVHIASWYEAKERAMNEFRTRYPNDWFIASDCDELPDYPVPVREAAAFCDRNGYDFVRGCFIDRIGPGGTLPAIDKTLPIEPQFPIGAWFSHPLLNAFPLKIALVRGAIALEGGQHYARGGVACPPRELFIPIHHYKWVAGIRERLARRIEFLRANNHRHWRESARFLAYMDATGGTINVDDPAFAAAECAPHYPHFAALTRELFPDGG